MEAMIVVEKPWWLERSSTWGGCRRSERAKLLTSEAEALKGEWRC